MSARRALDSIEVAVTGVGLVLAGCDDRNLFWEQLRSGDSQLEMVPDPAGAMALGRVTDFDARQYLGRVDERLYRRHSRAVQMYLAALEKARSDADLDLDGCDRERVGLFEGSSRDGFEYWHEKIKLATSAGLTAADAFTRADLLAGMSSIGPGVAASIHRIQGPTCTFSASCCSGAVAIGHAYREIRAGEIDVAFAGGHDAALCEPILAMYRSAGLLSTEREDPRRAIRPYIDSNGNAFGEGAVVLVLENRRHAEARGRAVLATIDGFSYGNGGIHPTHSDSTGARSARAIRSALAQAHLGSDDVDLVIGHGNGVPQSDRSELAYMASVFGPRSSQVPLLSTKPLWGHTLGASSALNVAAAVVVAHHGEMTPELASGSGAPITGERPDTVVCVSMGIGGHNSAVLVRAAA